MRKLVQVLVCSYGILYIVTLVIQDYRLTKSTPNNKSTYVQVLDEKGVEFDTTTLKFVSIKLAENLVGGFDSQVVISTLIQVRKIRNSLRSSSCVSFNVQHGSAYTLLEIDCGY